MQKKFLKAPLKYRRISSGYSGRRLHPILRVYKPHRGIDYAAAIGTPVQAVGDGIVLRLAEMVQQAKWLRLDITVFTLRLICIYPVMVKSIRSGAKS